MKQQLSPLQPATTTMLSTVNIRQHQRMNLSILLRTPWAQWESLKTRQCLGQEVAWFDQTILIEVINSHSRCYFTFTWNRLVLEWFHKICDIKRLPAIKKWAKRLNYQIPQKTILSEWEWVKIRIEWKYCTSNLNLHNFVHYQLSNSEKMFIV